MSRIEHRLRIRFFFGVNKEQPPNIHLLRIIYLTCFGRRLPGRANSPDVGYRMLITTPDLWLLRQELRLEICVDRVGRATLTYALISRRRRPGGLKGPAWLWRERRQRARSKILIHSDGLDVDCVVWLQPGWLETVFWPWNEGRGSTDVGARSEKQLVRAFDKKGRPVVSTYFEFLRNGKADPSLFDFQFFTIVRYRHTVNGLL